MLHAYFKESAPRRILSSSCNVRDFAEWVDFAYWWSSIGKGLRLQPVQQACFKCIEVLPRYSPSAPMPPQGCNLCVSRWCCSISPLPPSPILLRKHLPYSAQ